MNIETKEDVEQFIDEFEKYFVKPKSKTYSYFPLSYRGYFGTYAIIYYDHETKEWELSSSSERIKTNRLKEITEFIWNRKEEFNYTLHKASNCRCPKCEEKRWYAVGPTHRRELKHALCSRCKHSFELEKEIKDEYFSLPSK